ncbi:MAG: hypothetical protein KC777_00555 [Cyanobacteria bacterium HKST-UBA02]|nr:hypothetical protein [Cyanobacteria bacterium HKST-UBA02]
MRHSLTLLLMGFFLAFLEVVPGIPAPVEVGSSSLSSQTSGIKHVSFLFKQPMVERSQQAEESRVSRGPSAVGSSVEVCFINRNADHSAGFSCRSSSQTGRLWLLRQRMLL